MRKRDKSSVSRADSSFRKEPDMEVSEDIAKELREAASAKEA